MPANRLTADERFDAKWHLDPETGCHLWDGARGNGYGTFWEDGKYYGAHVWAWRRKNGPVPDGMHLDHFFCDTRRCCNPDHVRPATPRENALRSDCPTAWNLTKTHCKRGHEYSGDNLYVVPGKGHRQCRICKTEAKARFEAKRKAA